MHRPVAATARLRYGLTVAARPDLARSEVSGTGHIKHQQVTASGAVVVAMGRLWQAPSMSYVSLATSVPLARNCVGITRAAKSDNALRATATYSHD